MSTPILVTKSYLPQRPDVAPWPCLIEWLSESHQPSQYSGGKFISTSAPAGYGKTTLVSEWVDGFKPPVVFVQIGWSAYETQGLVKFLTGERETDVIDLKKTWRRTTDNVFTGNPFW
jgi:hypothetical protein